LPTDGALYTIIGALEMRHDPLRSAAADERRIIKAGNNSG
jgi:hypothetical protein